ncbi:putative peptidoglycan endopeptidase LytE [Methylacidimicrobium cyclopophantes]|uniref:Peptidoglycan endopeptidase LytE n=1 Tax=Methylacidimicrobium cyclopophantes TaxID=1041766 RepID=A0A5E6MBR2_9BACT|nr:LysM peptidoglycan-binding domain-containing protein [Methylacidimicrobium cyclopophantes]VVM06668.1 putative peptidoglycan endopeptidase LytE [Methylacidimicrobium cyclopophantes]
MRIKVFRVFACLGSIALLFGGAMARSAHAQEAASPPSASATEAAASSEAPAEPPPPGSTKYTVKQGDSLWKIGRKFKVTVDELRKVNGLKSDRLQIGQELIVPPSPAGKKKKEEAGLPSGTPMPPSTPNPPAEKQ